MWHLLSRSKATACYHRKQHKAIMDVCERWEPNGTAIHAGFTYWGQFIAHELGPRPKEVPHRTGRLDLDSVYGDVVNATSDGMLKVNSKNKVPYDLPRKKKKAQIADPRNDENLIVAQFHLLMMRLHNALAVTLMQNTSMQPRDAYLHARRYAIRIFHHVTREDFLRAVLLESVHDFLFLHGDTLFKGKFTPPKATNQQPAEVVLGALRFGHSMIRARYDLNDAKPKTSLKKIFKMTGKGGLEGNQELPFDFAVSWPHFFNFDAKVPTNPARPIDPLVTPEMKPVHNIIEKNLRQGYKAELPSGQEAVYQMLAAQPNLADLGLIPNPRPMGESPFNMDLLTNAGIADCTPFWMFTLLDSSRDISGGLTLGPFGSLFVGSAVKWAMESAERAEPGLPNIEDVWALTGLQLHRIQDVINFVHQAEGTTP